MADNNNQTLSAAFPNEINKPQAGGLQICDTGGNSMFDMNGLLAAAQVYNKMNTTINELIGMDVRWFRAVPQQRSQDVIFQEYTLSNVSDDPVCLKVVMPDGNIPDSKYNYDLMGLEYEVPLEIHIDKVYWEKKAGEGTAPQKKDIIYFPMANKLYQVISSYLLRGFMEQETTWKINLKKYSPEASRKEGDILAETIDKYTVSESEIFGEKLQSDIQKITDDKQMNPYNGTSQDKYKVIDEDLQVITSNVEMYGTLVAEAYYDLSTSRLYSAVSYKGSDIITADTDRCITCWTMIDPGVEELYDIIKLTPSNEITYPANCLMNVNSKNKGFQLGEKIEISRPGQLNFYATIINDSNEKDANYEIKIDETVITHLTSVSPLWYNSRNYKMKVQSPVNILDGSDETTGFKVDIYANQYIKINYGSQEHISILPNRLLNKEWYGVVVNIGNTWGQYNTYVYKQHTSDSTEKLENIFYETIDFNPEPTSVEQYRVNKSPSYLTNLRVYTSTMEEEKLRNELLSYFVKDGDQLIIGDNADPLLTAPYIGKQR